MSAEQMIAELVNLLESENAETGWAETVKSYVAAAGLDVEKSSPEAQLEALLELEKRRRADVKDTLGKLLDPDDEEVAEHASDLLGKANSSWFGTPTAGIARLRIGLLSHLFEHELEEKVAAVEAIPGGYSCVPQSCLYVAGDWLEFPDALELLPKVFACVDSRWHDEEHVADLRPGGRYGDQLATWTAELEQRRAAYATDAAAVEAKWHEQLAAWADSGASMARALSRDAALELFQRIASRS